MIMSVRSRRYRAPLAGGLNTTAEMQIAMEPAATLCAWGEGSTIYGTAKEVFMAIQNLTWGSNTPTVQGRLRELVLYIAEKTKDISDIGSTKINKTLYY